MQLAKFVALRLGAAAATMFGLVLVTFLALQLVPGSYADIILGPQATDTARANLSKEYGLDRPAHVQFGTWLLHLLQGDLGTSLRSGQPVASEVASKAPVTIEIAAIGGAMALLFGLALGLAAALAPATSKRRTVLRLSNLAFLSMPEILVGGVLVYLFSTYVLPLTVGGWVPISEDPAATLQAALLPGITVRLLGIGFAAAATRRAVETVMSEAYVSAAAARGATRRQLVQRHVPRNIAIPVLTVFGVYLGYLLGGAVIAEYLFSLNGLGRYVVDAAKQRDYTALQGGVVFAGAVFITVNMAIDILYGVIDPRITGGRSA